LEREFESFGSRIARERKSKDWSQDEFACEYSKRFGTLDTSTLNELEQDRIDPYSVPGFVDSSAALLSAPSQELHRLASMHNQAFRFRALQDRQVRAGVMAFRRARNL
jgi:transcriptional regulator with XRE-family HTH domain